MQIVEKSGEGLSRLYGVTVPMADLNQRLDARIAEVTPTLNIKGFRPGKVPQAHVRRLYGQSLMSEVVQATLTGSEPVKALAVSMKCHTSPNSRPPSRRSAYQWPGPIGPAPRTGREPMT